MSVWMWFLGAYAAGITALFVLAIRRKSDDSELRSEIGEQTWEDLSAQQRVEALVELAKLRQADLPWYERSLSVIGVIAFFSMLVGTGIQTVRSSVESARAEQLRGEVARLEDQRSRAETLLADVARAVASGWRQTGLIDAAGRQILRHRLEQLQASEGEQQGEVLEQYDIALILGDYSTAVSLLDQNLHLLDNTLPADQVTLAEYYFFTRSEAAARELLARVQDSLSSLPPETQLRAVALQVALGDPLSRHVGEVARIFRVDRDEAEARLSAAARRLNEAVRAR